ncbi:hypothetical protein [Clostridium botulinum]|nr:hypothetical protein [Clostridium botulinum]
MGENKVLEKQALKIKEPEFFANPQVQHKVKKGDIVSGQHLI